MFGGGYKAREVDPLQPIRPAAIRGHLRFWWRATAGARYASVADLHKAETELWGGASTKDNPAVGKVAIQVQILSAGEESLLQPSRAPFEAQRRTPARLLPVSVSGAEEAEYPRCCWAQASQLPASPHAGRFPQRGATRRGQNRAEGVDCIWGCGRTHATWLRRAHGRGRQRQPMASPYAGTCGVAGNAQRRSVRP
jgi:hypothetical protein